MNLSGETLIGQPIKKTHHNNKLYYCIIYLAPGDYHRFHAPANVTFSYINHYNGELMSVNPSFMKLFKSVLTVNERIGLIGQWKHGFFSYIPVAATGVGNIVINGINEINSIIHKSVNGSRGWSRHLVNLKFDKGQEIGRFEIGSTVALVFEAPEAFQWTLQGDSIKMGTPLGKLPSNKNFFYF